MVDPRKSGGTDSSYRIQMRWMQMTTETALVKPSNTDEIVEEGDRLIVSNTDEVVEVGGW
jgi:hypothetical protein